MLIVPRNLIEASLLCALRSIRFNGSTHPQRRLGEAGKETAS